MRFLSKREEALYRASKQLDQAYKNLMAQLCRNQISGNSENTEESETYIYIPLDGYTSSKYEARKRFLRAIKCETPEVLSSLVEHVLPHYQLLYRPEFEGEQDYLLSSSIFFCMDYTMQLDKDGKHSAESFDSWLLDSYLDCFTREGIVFLPQDIMPSYQILYLDDFMHSVPLRSEHIYNCMTRLKEHCSRHLTQILSYWDTQAVVRFEYSLRAWTEAWSISTKWCFDHILQTLNRWCRVGTSEVLDWIYALKGTRVIELDEEISFSFWHPECDLETFTWSLYEQKLDEAFKAAKAEYRNRIQKLASDRDQRLAIDKYKQEHFEWLAYFQVLKIEYDEIYEHYRAQCNIATVKAVEKAVKETANLIGLKLRPSKRRPGRPLKKE